MQNQSSTVEPTSESLPIGNAMLPAVLEDDVYDLELAKYLNDGINYSANTISKSDIGDLQQLAADSFYYGYLLAMNRFKNGR